MDADTFTRARVVFVKEEQQDTTDGAREETHDDETEPETDRVVRGVRDEETRDGVVRDAWERCVDCVGADNSIQWVVNFITRAWKVNHE